MHDAHSTCWTLIEWAAQGDAAQQSKFVEKYAPPIRAYLAARWQGSPRIQDIDDASQMVFLECFKPDGLLARAEPGFKGGFRAYLYGAARNVALRIESAQGRTRGEQPLDAVSLDPVGDETHLSLAFDRAWARQIMQEAAARQGESAVLIGEAALERIELLRLRFEENLPIRTIAERWKRDPAQVHHEYAVARREFRRALLDVISFHHPDNPQKAKEECSHLLAVLA